MDVSLNDRQEWEALLESGFEPTRVLEAVTSSLLVLHMDDADHCGRSVEKLVDLHGALLLFQLAGQVELLPSTGFALFGYRSFERRIVRAASRIAGGARGPEASFAAWRRSGERIEQMIGIIDPELAQLVA